MSAAHAPGPHTLVRWLPDADGAAGERIAIDDRGVTVTYRELAHRVDVLADGLRSAGFRNGDRIATLSGNSIDHVVLFFACAATGLVFVPLSWRLTPTELAPILERADPALLVVEEEFAALARAARERTAVSCPVVSPGVGGLEAAVPVIRTDAEGGMRAVRDDDPLLVIFTSGSEGRPKGVVLSHANCFWNNLALAGAIQLTAADVVLAMLPQFHIAGWNVQPLLAWHVGATVVLERGFRPDRVHQLIRERRVTAVMGVPTQYRLLVDEPSLVPEDVASLRIAMVGGATTTPELSERWRALGVPLTQGYGLTEAAPNVLVLPAADSAAHPGCVGRPYAHVALRIVDPPTGLPLEGAATGELQVRGPSVFRGYLGDTAATTAAMDGDWLRTGDVATRDAAGVYRIVDRLKDIFISGGENVAPVEVERALETHRQVAAAAVVGAPDAVWGERGVAFVVPVAGAALSVEDLLAHAATMLAAYKLPVRVEVVAELPRSTIEKLARARLRARARALVEDRNHESA